MMRIALAQFNPTVGDLDGNRDKILYLIAQAQDQGADLVVFPEMAVTGYPPEDLLLKSHFIARNHKVLKEITASVRDITAVIGFVDGGKNGLYNAAAVINNRRVKGIYHKAHLPNYSVFDEKRYFRTGGGQGLYTLGKVTFGVTICEDIWIDQGPAWEQACAGATLILNLSCSPYEVRKRHERLRLLKKRVRETGAAFVYVNVIGGQDELVFDGSSMVLSDRGKVLATGAAFCEDLVLVDMAIPERRVKDAVLIPVRKDKAPSLAIVGRESPALSVEAEMYEALVLGTRDYVQKNGFKKVLIGLSGGIDSALVAAIAVDAVGAENVVVLSMPTRFNAAATRQDARLLAENLKINFSEIPIESVLASFLAVLAPAFAGQPPGLAEENLQARIRGTLLMAFSNKFGWLVLTTGNKSEMATGYCTLYGDMSGGFAVIKDIVKTQVYALCVHVNGKAGRDIIPSSILTRAPSAELRFNQTDQDSLPPYATLDALLGVYVEEHKGLSDMTRLCGDAKMARKVVELVDKSEYKRRQAPPGIKMSRRAFGKDWRLPLTNKYKADGA
jgi:NAD+ synthase (glutamine-hydrolysing)